MKANRKQVLKEIDNVMNQVVEKSTRIKSFDISSCGGTMIQLTIYDEWGKYIDCAIGTPCEVLCNAKLWLYSLIKCTLIK